MSTNDLHVSGMYHVTGRRLTCKRARRYAFAELVSIDPVDDKLRIATFFQAWRNLTVRFIVADIQKVVEA